MPAIGEASEKRMRIPEGLGHVVISFGRLGRLAPAPIDLAGYVTNFVERASTRKYRMALEFDSARYLAAQA